MCVCGGGAVKKSMTKNAKFSFTLTNIFLIYSLPKILRYLYSDVVAYMGLWGPSPSNNLVLKPIQFLLFSFRADYFSVTANKFLR